MNHNDYPHIKIESLGRMTKTTMVLIGLICLLAMILAWVLNPIFGGVVTFVLVYRLMKRASHNQTKKVINMLNMEFELKHILREEDD